ncbi:hypothetical protein T01_13546 [Trichinella spiralis]|uniref:Uncharacterized protein n=1 Tax=Trichinella spiralis TaxID=6334 RepID=A0A0V1BRK1_TRISP|nr:hypothetical protein T01_13546 [Trichinella spiralis]
MIPLLFKVKIILRTVLQPHAPCSPHRGTFYLIIFIGWIAERNKLDFKYEAKAPSIVGSDNPLTSDKHKPTTSGTCTNRDTSTQIFQLCRLCLRILNLLLDRLFYCSLLNNKQDNRVMTNCLSKSNINVKIFSKSDKNASIFTFVMKKNNARLQSKLHKLPFIAFIALQE